MSLGTVFVVDDDEDIRESIRDLVVSVGINCKTYESADAFFRADTESGPSAVILDVRLPGIGGLEIQKTLVAKGATAPVIFVTGYGDVWTAVQAMKRGAFDFFEKPFSSQELLTRIQAAIGQHVEHLAEKSRLKDIDALLQGLTPRERDILERLGLGKSNKTIAAELAMSVRTVEFHRARMMQKLRARSREDLTRIAIEGRQARDESD
ncbi:response regulator transcription factor [Shumkonia mesophila]|uniref:response regulator transcription factor n=1 Tax=Shumkonia mesophila TaxID=2838854 RepID=UPI0029343B2A|nr:response regulator [Shumkonia mesophila]